MQDIFSFLRFLNLALMWSIQVPMDQKALKTERPAL
jgi:hypothetical protein